MFKLFVNGIKQFLDDVVWSNVFKLYVNGIRQSFDYLLWEDNNEFLWEDGNCLIIDS
jgi:hypothetical protein